MAEVGLRHMLQIAALRHDGGALEPVGSPFVTAYGDAVIERAQPRLGVAEIEAAPRIDQGGPRLDAHLRQHGADQFRHVLAVADAVGEDVAQGPRREPALAERKGEIADVFLNPAHRRDDPVRRIGVRRLDLRDDLQKAIGIVFVALEARAHHVVDALPAIGRRGEDAARGQDPARHVRLVIAGGNMGQVETDLAVAVVQRGDGGLRPARRKRLQEYPPVRRNQQADMAAVPIDDVLQRRRHGKFALKTGRVAAQRHRHVDQVADAHVRQGHGQRPAPVQHQPLERALAPQHQKACLDIDLDDLIAAQDTDMMNLKIVVIRVERHADIGQLLQGRQVDDLLDGAVIALRAPVQPRLIVHQPGVEPPRRQRGVKPVGADERLFAHPAGRGRETDSPPDLLLEHPAPPVRSLGVRVNTGAGRAKGRLRIGRIIAR